MPYRLMYLDNADVVACADSRDEALALLANAVHQHPELEGELGVQEVDKYGDPVSDVLTEKRSSVERPPALF